MIVDFFVKNKNYLIVLFTGVYLAVFSVNAFFSGNLEFIYYIIIMSAIILAIVFLNRFLHLAFFIIFNLSLLGFFHLLGGNFYFGSVRLYEYYFLAGVIRYDNLVHVYGTFIATIILYSLASPFIDEKLKRHFPLLAIGLVLMAIGTGVLNELVELAAVVFFDAAEQVGGYFNNALDLLFNTIGSIVATIIIYFYVERPKRLAMLKRK